MDEKKKRSYEKVYAKLEKNANSIFNSSIRNDGEEIDFEKWKNNMSLAAKSNVSFIKKHYKD